MEHLEHHGRETAYRHVDRGGEGPTVLFVHGSGGNRRVWNGQLELADEFPVVAVDLSGHGDSTDVDAEPGYETLAAYIADVAAVAEATDAEVLVGSSLGGAVIQRALIDGDLTVDGAVLAGTGARLAVLDDLLGWLHSDFERAVDFLHGTDRLFHDPDEAALERSRGTMFDTGRAVTERDFRTSHEFDVRGDLDRIDVPTLAICGEFDRLTPPRYHQFLVDEIDDAELAIVEDAAHLAMVEQPRAFSRALSDFLDRRW